MVRVWLPDRPGALGQVASRVGAVRGDVTGIDILESGDGRVVDELVVKLPAAVTTNQLVAEIRAVDGVSVEDVREIDHASGDRRTLALRVAVAVAESDPAELLGRFVAGLAEACDADWVAVVADQQILQRYGDVPEAAWLVAFLAGSEHLRDSQSASATGELLQVRLPGWGAAVAAGRADRPFHALERERAALIARVADVGLQAIVVC